MMCITSEHVGLLAVFMPYTIINCIPIPISLGLAINANAKSHFKIKIAT